MPVTISELSDLAAFWMGVRMSIRDLCATKFVIAFLIVLLQPGRLNDPSFACIIPEESYPNDIQPIEVDGQFEPLGERLFG